MIETCELAWRVAMRHWDVYRQNLFANLSPTVSDPVFIMLALGVGLGAYVSELDGRSYLLHLAAGLTVATALWTAFFETSYGFFVRHTYVGVYQALATTPIGPREIVLGEFLWVAIKGAGMSTGVTLVLLPFGAVQPHLAWTIPPIGALVAVACGGIGFISSGLVKNINQFQTVYALLINPLFFFSGVFFPLTETPRLVQVISHLSPLYHGVRLGQAALWNEGFLAALAYHGPFLVAITAVLAYWGGRAVFPKLYR